MRSLRLQRGWSIEQLAHKAICSVKTVQNAERSNKLFLATIIKLANALGLADHQELLVLDDALDEALPPQNPSEKRIRVYIIIDIPTVREFDEATQLPLLQEHMRTAIAAAQRIGVISVEDGSVKIGLEMGEDDVLQMVAAFCQTKLDAVGIKQLILPSIQLPLSLDIRTLTGPLAGYAFAQIPLLGPFLGSILGQAIGSGMWPGSHGTERSSKGESPANEAFEAKILRILHNSDASLVAVKTGRTGGVTLTRSTTLGLQVHI